MRRLARRLFTLCSAVSLVLFLAACVLWVRSYFVGDQLRLNSWTSGYGRVEVVHREVLSTWGCLTFSRNELSSTDPDAAARVSRTPPPTVSYWAYARVGRNRLANQLVPHTMRVRNTSPMNVWASAYNALQVPFWMVSACFAVAPAAWLVRHHGRRRRQQLGQCPSCGYDLRATPGRCPECGTATSEVAV